VTEIKLHVKCTMVLPNATLFMETLTAKQY